MEPGEFLVDSAPATLPRTALNGVHRALGAKMVNFGGWDMPVEYPSTGGQVPNIRPSAGVWVCSTSATWAIFEFTAGVIFSSRPCARSLRKLQRILMS
jgi:glycine cleavage system aminomethyltransferase T